MARKFNIPDKGVANLFLSLANSKYYLFYFIRI